MPKKANSLPTVVQRVSTNPMVMQYLSALVRTGLYGKNETEVAEHLIRKEIARMIATNELEKLPDYEL